MCEECRQSPCHPRCPNATEPIPVFICSATGEDIYEGEDYWDIFGEQFSEDGISNARRTAEEDLFCFVNDDLICEGETYYEIMGKPVCECCVNEARREAFFCDYFD